MRTLQELADELYPTPESVAGAPEVSVGMLRGYDKGWMTLVEANPGHDRDSVAGAVTLSGTGYVFRAMPSLSFDGMGILMVSMPPEDLMMKLPPANGCSAWIGPRAGYATADGADGNALLGVWIAVAREGFGVEF